MNNVTHFPNIILITRNSQHIHILLLLHMLHDINTVEYNEHQIKNKPQMGQPVQGRIQELSVGV